MNSNLVTQDTNLKPSKKFILRRQASFAFLGTIVFAIQWRFSLGNIGTSLLVVGLAFLYGLAFPGIVMQGQNQEFRDRNLSQTVFKFVWLILAAIVISLIWFWLSQTTGIPSKILAVITFVLTGLSLIVWSYLPFSDE